MCSKAELRLNLHIWVPAEFLWFVQPFIAVQNDSLVLWGLIYRAQTGKVRQLY